MGRSIARHLRLTQTVETFDTKRLDGDCIEHGALDFDAAKTLPHIVILDDRTALEN